MRELRGQPKEERQRYFAAKMRSGAARHSSWFVHVQTPTIRELLTFRVGLIKGGALCALATNTILSKVPKIW